MRRSWFVPFALGGLGVLAMVAVLTVGSAAAARHSDHHGNQGWHGGEALLRAELSPSVPSDPAIFGVSPGGAPWQLAHARVRLGESGRLDIDVDGLVLTTTGANPLPDLAATIYCGGTAAATTAPVPFSTKGDAHIRTMVTLPAFCPAPAVLINPATGSSPSSVITTAYIAFDGTA